MNDYIYIALINIIGSIWITCCFCYVILFSDLLRGRFSSNDIALGIVWVFYAVPLALSGTFHTGPNFRAPLLTAASQDLPTAIINGIFLSSFSLLLVLFRKPVDLNNKAQTGRNPRKQQAGVFYLLSISMLVLTIGTVVTSPAPSAYLNYGYFSNNAMRRYVTAAMAEQHMQVALLSLGCILFAGIALMLNNKKDILIEFLFNYLPLVLPAIWLVGKRNTVAFAALFFVGRVFLGKRYSALLKITILVMVSIGFGFYSNWYQSQRELSDAKSIESYLVNYGRDHCTRLAIFTELTGNNILEYSGQSFLFDVVMYYPRSWWENKPWPYATYFTSKAFDNYSLRVYGWHFTTSILDEFISNFSWLGLLLGPLFMLCLCRLNDKEVYDLLRFQGYLVIVLLLLIHIPAFYFIFCSWLLLVLFRKLFFGKELQMRCASDT